MRWKWVLAGLILLVVGAIAVGWVIITHYDYNRLKPQIENALREATGRELTLRGNLDLKIGLTPALVVHSAALQNAPWGSRPQMAEIERLEVRLSLIPLLSRRIDVKRIVLVHPDVLIETNPAGASNLAFLKETAAGGVQESSGAKRVKLALEEIDIEDGQVTYRNGGTGRTYLVAVRQFKGSAQSPESPLKVLLSGAYNLRPFEIKGDFMPIGSLTDANRPWPFNLRVDAEGTSVNLSGTIRSVAELRGLDVKVVAKSKNVATIGGFVGKALPVQGPLDMSCRLTDQGPEAYRFAPLKIVIGGSDFDGSFLITLGKRPSFTADLRSARVDLRPFVGQKKTPVEEPFADKVFPDSPLSLGWLHSVEGAVNLKAGQVLSPWLTLRDLDAALGLKDGRLSTRPLTAVISGGRIALRLDLESRGKISQVQAEATVSQLDIGALLGELKATSLLEGRVDADIRVSSRGDSVASLMSGLSGTVYAIMGAGRINNRYVGLLGSSVSTDIFRMVNPIHRELPTTAVSCIVCGFKITKGVAETTALVANSDYTSVVGEGTIDLRREGLDFTFRPIPKQGIGTGITGKLSLSVGELTRPLKLVGTLSHPSLGIDLTRSAIAVGKAVGGFMLFGPAGIGSVLLSEGSSGKDVCPLAIKAARQGVKLSLTENKGIVGRATEGVEKGLGAVGKGLKSLFGR